MADQSDIDPRYAAQFQRGYSPERDVVPDRPQPVRLAGGPPPTAQRVPDPRPRVEPPPESVEAPIAVDPEPTRRSRFEWALLGVGIGLLLAAGAFFAGAVELQESYSGWGPGFEGQLFGAATDVLPGPLLLGGVSAIVLWIVLRATSAPWSRG